MKPKSVSEIVDGLTEEEKLQFKDIIEESFQREAELKEIKIQTQESLALLEEDLKKIVTNLSGLKEQLNVARDELLALKYILSNTDPIIN